MTKEMIGVFLFGVAIGEALCFLVLARGIIARRGDVSRHESPLCGEATCRPDGAPLRKSSRRRRR